LSQLTKKFPAFYGTRRFFTVLTSARHLSLSWANSIQSPRSPPTSWTSILILFSHLRLGLPNGLFPSGNNVHLQLQIRYSWADAQCALHYTTCNINYFVWTIYQQWHYSDNLLIHSTAPTCFDLCTSSSGSFLCMPCLVTLKFIYL
jgi:hypothetical protein